MRSRRKVSAAAFSAALALVLGAGLSTPAPAASEQQSLEELRNTVINLLQALVDQGLMTREKAQQLVKQAQDKAAADLAARNQEEQNSVRVPYIPEIVKQEISKEVAAQVRPEVAADVVKEAKSEGWGVPGAMPDWLRSVRVSGEVTVRGQLDLYGHGNDQGCPPGTLYQNCTILDYAAINAAGGISKAGANAFLNITQDRDRARARARLGADAELSDNWHVGIRVSSGTLQDPGSEMQTLGQESGRYTVGFDRIFIRWDAKTAAQFPYLTGNVGRFASPFFSPTELVWQRDLALEGTSFGGRLGFGDGSRDQSNAFLTIGAFPVQEIALLNKQNKYLFAGQLGTSLRWGDSQRLTLAFAYYDFQHMEGIPNTLESTLTNYSAPLFIRQGNSYIPISNTADPTVDLFALASKFRIEDVALAYILPLGRYTLNLNAEGARNIGFNRSEILARTGFDIEPRTKGYVADISFGDPAIVQLGQWRWTYGYRYVQRDAVLDALTDADFHEGGTNSAGFFSLLDFGLAHNVWTRLRYLSGKEIDGPRYHLDVWQLDLNARF